MKYIITIICFLSLGTTLAQNINWTAQEEAVSNFIYLNLEYDYGLTPQAGFAINTDFLSQTFISADISAPMGKNLFDDYKARLAMHSNIYSLGNFIISGKLAGIARRQETALVRIYNFGTEVKSVVGYYKPNFHIAIEMGFDKAIATHLKHQGHIQENFPEITDSWFVPTGGNFSFGIQISQRLAKRLEASLRFGKTKAEKGAPDPLLPVYGGLNFLYHL